MRSLIAECISEDRIFDGTVLENLTVGKEINQDVLHEIIVNTGLVEFIQKLPSGYHTEIGPQGKSCLLYTSTTWTFGYVLKTQDHHQGK